MKCLTCNDGLAGPDGFCPSGPCQAERTISLQVFGNIPIGTRVLITRKPGWLDYDIPSFAVWGRGGEDGEDLALYSATGSRYCCQVHIDGRKICIDMKPYAPPFLPGWWRLLDSAGNPIPGSRLTPNKDQFVYDGLWERISEEEASIAAAPAGGNPRIGRYA